MSILLDVVKELLGMFLADARLTVAILVLVAVTSVLVLGLHAGPVVAGGLLAVGSLVLVVEAAVREARRRKI